MLAVQQTGQFCEKKEEKKRAAESSWLSYFYVVTRPTAVYVH